jgi:hypothetical protein
LLSEGWDDVWPGVGDVDAGSLPQPAKSVTIMKQTSRMEIVLFILILLFVIF